MSDYSELKRLAEAATPGPWQTELAYPIIKPAYPARGSIASALIWQDGHFIAAANPAAVLALIAENEALRGVLEIDPRHHVGQATIAGLEDARDQLKADLDEARNGMKHQAALSLKKEIERLKAEVESVRKIAIELRSCAECSNVHHCRAEQHEFDEPCKVLARIDAAMSKDAGQ